MLELCSLGTSYPSPRLIYATRRGRHDTCNDSSFHASFSYASTTMPRSTLGAARPSIRTRRVTHRLRLCTSANHPRFQHTRTLIEVAKPRRQISRIGPLAIALVATVGGYGVFQALQSDSASQKTLNVTSFTPFRLVGKEDVSSTCSIFTLEQPALHGSIIRDMWAKGVWSIEIKQPQLQIARAYTPLPPLDPAAPDHQLRLLVRRERRGEMSNYTHNTPIDGTLGLRGPSVEHEIVDPEKIERVAFLAGGTGIAPALQIARTLQNSTDISILWANRRREDCEGGESDTMTTSQGGFLARLGARLGISSQSYAPILDSQTTDNSHAIVRQLSQIKAVDASSVKVDYFVDQEGAFIQAGHVSAVLSQAPSATPTSGERVIFVSGPEGFLNYWAGPKEWRDGREVQGTLGGVLSRIDIQGWKVVKL